jgi:hypothetical protein
MFIWIDETLAFYVYLDIILIISIYLDIEYKERRRGEALPGGTI